MKEEKETEKFEIVKTMRRHKGRWIYFIEETTRKQCNGQFNTIVGRIIWDGKKWVVDMK